MFSKITCTLFGASHRGTDVSNEYPWPNKLDPGNAHLYTYNELDMPGVSAEAVWTVLTHAAAWPDLYEHAYDLTFAFPQDEGSLHMDSAFEFTAFKVRQAAVVTEFLPNKRLAWSFTGPRKRKSRTLQ
jgi:hypothetical protein